jgi:23S rRNA pseudouridine1911/1915/1917 synthase
MPDVPTTPGEKTVPQELGGRPLDGVVRALFGATWGDARKWIASGKVRVDGVTVTDHEKHVRAGVGVALVMNAPRAPKAGRGRGTELTDDAIVHLDTHVVVVNKPAGVSTVPFDEKDKGTLDELVRNWLSKRTKRTKTSDRSVRPSLGVVHRLDKETSGVMVFTRTWLAKQSLTQQFRAHTTERRYVAIAHGQVEGRTLRSMLMANRGDGLRGSRKGKGGTGDEGQLAVTHVEAVEALAGATLIACRLETGRTHQIRIHLSESGHPIVGERVYIRGFQGEEIPAPRLMLHAAELGFVHPATNVAVHFERPPPADFEETIGRLRRR